VPQNRERVFIVGHLRGESSRKVFPIRRKNSKIIKQSGNIVDDSDIDFKNPQRGRVYDKKGLSPSLNTMQGGGLEPKIVECINTYNEEGIQRSIQDRIFNADKISPALTSFSNNSNIKNEEVVRKLTPKECWRLQGFPDKLFDKAAEVNSDSQLYKQAGNSVTVNVIEEIGRRLS